jgi:hypothetical protein
MCLALLSLRVYLSALDAGAWLVAAYVALGRNHTSANVHGVVYL